MKDKNFWIMKKVGVFVIATGRAFVMRALSSGHIVVVRALGSSHVAAVILNVRPSKGRIGVFYTQ